MEQMTASEWFREQVRRAPSFTAAAAIMFALLVVTMFIDAGAGSDRPERLGPVITGLESEQEEPLSEFNDRLEPLPPEIPPVRDAPREAEVNWAALDQPSDAEIKVGEITVSPVELSPEEPAPGDSFPDRVSPRAAVIGTGPGGSNLPDAYRGRDPDGKARAIRKYRVSKDTLRTIEAGLWWLAKVQEDDGGWEVRRWGGSKANERAGVSGLALLAFLGNGYTDSHSRFGSVVRRAVAFLLDRQHSEGPNRGWFGERMYTQGICTMALCELYTLRGGPDKHDPLQRELKAAAQNGIDYILARQPEHGGFGYRGGGNDMSVTGWQVMAMKSALLAKLHVPEQARDRTARLLRVCLAEDYSTPYRFSPTGDTRRGTPRMTAVSLTCRLFMGRRPNHPECAGQAKWLSRDDRHLDVAHRAQDLYYIYYASMAMFQMRGDYLNEWKNAFDPALRKRQERKGPTRGSWPVEGSAYGSHGGRVYTTAMALLSLEVYFKFMPLYRHL
jgi:hypothetical protein